MKVKRLGTAATKHNFDIRGRMIDRFNNDIHKKLEEENTIIKQMTNPEITGENNISCPDCDLEIHWGNLRYTTKDSYFETFLNKYFPGSIE